MKVVIPNPFRHCYESSSLSLKINEKSKLPYLKRNINLVFMGILHLGQIGIRNLLKFMFNEICFDSDKGLRAQKEKW